MSVYGGWTLFANSMEQSEYGTAHAFGGSRYSQTSVHWQYANETGRSLEGLFQKMTLSLLSAATPTTNETTGDQISTRVTTFPNTYLYSRFDLGLPYGIGIAATILCVAIEFEAMFRNRATYSTRFSTILRTTRNAQFDTLVGADDDGSDPLSKGIAQAELSHAGHRGSGKEATSGRAWRRSNNNSNSKLGWRLLSTSNSS